jgi:hypothetical protein
VHQVGDWLRFTMMLGQQNIKKNYRI